MLFNAWRHVLASLRRRRNLSQRQAAQRAGVSRKAWNRWELGLTNPGPGRLEAIARAVGCPPEKVGFEYSRLLYRYYCQQLGYECPAPRPLAGAGEASRCRSRSRSGRPVPSLASRGGSVTCRDPNHRGGSVTP